MKYIFTVEEYNEHIPLLLSNNKTGVVHSVFNNGLNIRMGSHLFFIGTTKNGRLPFGVHLEQEAINQIISFVSLHQTVTWNEKDNRLHVGNTGLTIDFNAGKSFTNQLRQIENSKSLMLESLENFLTLLVNYGEPTGLEIDIERFLVDHLEGNHAQTKTVKQINALMDAVTSNDEMEIESVLRYLLGRGKGLTPSGDDHIVGLLAVLTVTKQLSSTFVKTIKGLIEQESITTEVAMEYLQYATKGEFSSSVTAVIYDLVQKKNNTLENSMLKLIAMGHSSGVDTAFGILIGILANRRLTNNG